MTTRMKSLRRNRLQMNQKTKTLILMTTMMDGQMPMKKDWAQTR